MAENNTNLKEHYSWLNNDFFQRILSKEHPNVKIIIEDFHAKPALSYGENYASQMIRVIVPYVIDDGNAKKTCEQRFVIKALVIDEVMAKMTKEFKIFDKEIIVYQHVIPAVEKLLLSIGDDTKLSPRCFEASAEHYYLVFEDLAVKKFRNTDRRKGLDINHYELLLTKLAKWHAGTAVLQTKEFSYIDEFQNSMMYDENSMEMKKFMGNCIDTVVKVAQKDSNCSKEFANKIESNIDGIFTKVCRLTKPDDNVFNVLTHGDLWANNTMYVYDDDADVPTPKDAIMVDFQIGMWGPAVIDLAYTLFTSSNENLTDIDWDYLLQHYHNELKSTLLKLDYTKHVPTLTDIQAQFVQKAACMAPISLFVLGIRHFEDADETTNSRFIGETEEDIEYRYKIVSNPNGRKSFNFLLDYFDRKGLLEVTLKKRFTCVKYKRALVQLVLATKTSKKMKKIYSKQRLYTSKHEIK